ncbi:MAG: hydrolase [Anaerolinea sp.]|nr:hydrolase [Anaerolinea sp.]
MAETLALPVDRVELAGDLVLPAGAEGLVVFVHGSGSSRFSPRNRRVAAVLNDATLGTLLLDLLTPDEEAVDERTRRLRFDIPMLSQRVIRIIDWLATDGRFTGLRIGCFGASTGAAAALIAAAQRPALVHAVVSRGGRPDLADEQLAGVRAPTLLIVGGADDVVLELNRSALRALRCEKRLDVVPEATHLFEERGALDRVAKLAQEWFSRYLSSD